MNFRHFAGAPQSDPLVLRLKCRLGVEPELATIGRVIDCFRAITSIPVEMEERLCLSVVFSCPDRLRQSDHLVVGASAASEHGEIVIG
jgi:hypothetical protein